MVDVVTGSLGYNIIVSNSLGTTIDAGASSGVF